jgi:hypothetical protein
VNPCRICGTSRGGAPEGERYCSKCEASLSMTLTPKQQAERRVKKVKRTDEGVFTPWSLRYWIRAGA